MPEFFTFSTHTQARAPEVSRPLHNMAVTNITQVMVHVEQHEMVDIRADSDMKWSEQSSSREETSFKARAVV